MAKKEKVSVGKVLKPTKKGKAKKHPNKKIDVKPYNAQGR